MIRKKIISKLLICCLLVQILTIMNSQDDGYLEEVIEKETRPHWLHATDGNIEVVILASHQSGYFQSPISIHDFSETGNTPILPFLLTVSPKPF